MRIIVRALRNIREASEPEALASLNAIEISKQIAIALFRQYGHEED